MYKDLIRVMFNETPAAGEKDSGIPKESVIPLERKINTLIMKINDQIEEIESGSLGNGKTLIHDL